MRSQTIVCSFAVCLVAGMLAKSSVAASRNAESATHRIVLTWGATPRDLDAHLQVGETSVFYLKRFGHGARLEADAKSGHGPEIVTIVDRQQTLNYVYAVHDYAAHNKRQSSALSASGATVLVYSGQTLQRKYSVPQSKNGNLWAVFALGADGEIGDINEIIDAVPPMTSQAKDLFGIQASLGITRWKLRGADPAKRIVASLRNSSGELAYREGNLNKALSLFSEAVDHDPEFSEAFSNLGLTLQKLGRTEEALLANSKAIALATGPAASTIRANTHYNSGRIYEKENRLGDALREYELANAETRARGYDRAIRRVSSIATTK